MPIYKIDVLAHSVSQTTVVYMLAKMLGLIAIFKVVPAVYIALKFAGAVYLLWLAWNAIKPGSTSALQPRALPLERPRKLF